MTVLGPNGIDDATFHVHHAGCKDLNAAKYRRARADGTWDVTVSTEQELIETLHGDFIGTDETREDTPNGWKYTTWESYRNETRIFPCVKLSQTVEARGQVGDLPPAKPAAKMSQKRLLDDALAVALAKAPLDELRAQFGDKVVEERLHHHLKYMAPGLYLDR